MNEHTLKTIWRQYEFVPFTSDEAGYQEWSEYTKKAYCVLVQAARLGRTIKYGEIANQIGLYSPDYFELKIGSIVGACSLYEQLSNRPLISAIAVNAETGRPSEGFWRLPGVPRGVDRDEFWAQEVQRVFGTWAGGENDAEE
ncbi:MAG: hypothetical protein NUV77_24025 [Thermoguttaceae bacterium]|jgi:hypothetical protein|nr:hypothetical protein [Thermoguttaceae bacterium]